MTFVFALAVLLISQHGFTESVLKLFHRLFIALSLVLIFHLYISVLFLPDGLESLGERVFTGVAGGGEWICRSQIRIAAVNLLRHDIGFV